MISTNDNVRIETFPRVAGVESGRLYNDWLDCRFTIEPAARPDLYKWTVFYKATDTASDCGGFPATVTFYGFGQTRAHAHRLLVNITTRRIKAVLDARKHYLRRRLADAKISIDAGIPLATPFLLSTGGLDHRHGTSIPLRTIGHVDKR